MNAEHVNAFVQAYLTVVPTATSMIVKRGEIYSKRSPFNTDDVIIVIGVTGDVKGQVMFTVSKLTALKVVSAMMGGAGVNDFDDMSRSAICELANMIMGNSAMLLYNKGLKIDITPPSFVTGQHIQISSDKIVTICIPFVFTEGQVMEMCISLVENQ